MNSIFNSLILIELHKEKNAQKRNKVLKFVYNKSRSCVCKTIQNIKIWFQNSLLSPTTDLTHAW